MNIKSWLKEAKNEISPLDAELIALHVFAPSGADRTWLVLHEEEEVDDAQRKKADRLLLARANGTPLAYIVGEKEFYGRKFMVRPGVLIPRPETEDIINLIKTLELPQQPRFLEIGTGSGCIAVTLALEYPQAFVLASDISETALEVASANDILHEGRIELTQSNMFRDFDFEQHKTENFDVIIANLPYVNKEWSWLDQKSLSFEPANAVFARGNNGMSMYQRFFKEYDYHQNGHHDIWANYVVIEADPCQHRDLVEMAAKHGLVYTRRQGYCLLFEDNWRYWYDIHTGDLIHKSEEVLQEELKTGAVHFFPEEL